MTEPKWHAEPNFRFRPEPTLYRLETTLDGQRWFLQIVRDRSGQRGGSPTQRLLLLPKHDAETVRDMLESHYGEGWTLARDD